MRLRTMISTAAVIAGMAMAGAAKADTILWIDDARGNLGTVNLTTSTVTVIGNTGQILTDIGFTADGTLYGTTFTGLYTVSTTTAAATAVAGYSGVSSMNALVGAGAGLQGAANTTSTVYNVDPATAVLTTLAPSGGGSAGDLAYSGGVLYEALANGNFYDVTHATTVGPMGVANVFGLADDGTTMYAVAGTEVYTVNLSTGALTPIFNYTGHGLEAANGTAFFSEASNVPEPASTAVLASGLAGLGWLRRARRR